MRRGRSRGACCACWGAFVAALSPVLAPAPARADAAPPSAAPSLVLVSASLEYALGPGASQCPGEARLHEEVARRLGYDPFAPDAGGRAMGTMRTVIARADQGLTATTEYVDASGALRWTKAYGVKGATARDCEVVVSGVAIQIAAALTVIEEAPKPAAALALPAAPPPSLSEPVAPARSDDRPAPRAAPADHRRSRPPRLEIGAGVAAVIGMAATVVASGTAHLGVQVFPFVDRGPWLSFAAELRGDAPASSNGGSSGGASVRTSMLAGSGLVCVHWDRAPRAVFTGSLFGCIVGTAGKVSGTFAGTDAGASADLLYVAAGVRPGIEARFADIAALRLQAEGLGAIRPARFDGSTAVAETSRLSLGVGVAGVILF